MCFSKQTFAHLSHISKGCSIIPLAMDSRLGLDNSPTKPLWIGQFFISNTLMYMVDLMPKIIHFQVNKND
jgi:hypothetical protein